MSNAETPTITAHIQEIIQEIVRRFRPRRVILFGSYAYGTPKEGSDLDFLVVASKPLSRMEAWKVALELRQQFSLPIQVVFISPEEFEETKDVVGGIAYPAHHWGRVLFDETNS